MANTAKTAIVRGASQGIGAGRRQAKMIKHAKLAEIPNGPHGFCWTHGKHVNAELVLFVE